MKGKSPRDERSPWDAVAQNYTGHTISPLAIGVENPIWGLLPELASSRSRGVVVDFGCGTGVLLRRLLERWPFAVGLDFSISMLEEAGKLTEKKDGTRGSRLIQGDMRQLPLQGESVDLAFSINSILPERAEDVTFMFDEIAATLKPDGILVANFPSLDAVLYLKELRSRAYRKAGLGEKETDQFLHEEFTVRHKLDEESGLYALDGKHVQKLFWPDEIRGRIKACGLNLESLSKVVFPWEMMSRHGFGNFPEEKPLWNWLAVAQKRVIQHSG